MYAPYFGLSKEPFSIAPDPRFLFMSDQHREALAHLLYGLGGGGGFVLLTGEIGAGKTTVCRCFLEQVPAHCAVAYVFNPKLTAVELLQTVCAEFGIRPPADATSVKAHVDALNAFLLRAHAEGRQAVLVIDEAQALSADVLEQLRLLTNLETAERKLLQIVLIGQPELRGMVARRELEQLGQRVIARYHLGALSFAETQQYIRHRLAVAGPAAGLPFDDAALRRIHALSGGVPRRINLLADRALLGAYAQGRQRADKRTVAQAAREVFGTAADAARGNGNASRLTPALGWSVAAVALLTAAAALVWGWQRDGRPSAAVQMAAARAGSGTGVAASTGLPASAATTAPAVGVAVAAPASGPAGNAPVPSVSAPAPATFATAAPVVTAGTASSPIAAPLAPSDAASTDPAALLAAALPQPALAWRELALRWNVAIGEGEPCAAAAQANLACFRSAAGGLPVLRQLARPGVVGLRLPTGTTAYAVLVSLDERQATLQVASQRFVLSLPALASVWRGEVSTFWRTPPGWRDGADAPLGPQALAWIGDQLAAAGFGDAQPLRQRVWSFQLAQGLTPDGVAGPLTLMRLNAVAGVDEPRLDARTVAAR